MKKILLATTLLAGTAGFAAAEVTLSGDGRMGVTYTEGLDKTAGSDSNLAFSSRARVKFTLSGTTDGGLEFGGSFRAHQAAGAANGLNGTVFISGAFGKLSMGDIDSAANSAVGQLAEVGYTGLGTLNEIGYLTSGDDEGALYEYSANGFTGYLSVGQPGDLTSTYSLGAKYATDAFSVAAGYEAADVAGAGDITQTSVSASGTFSGVTVMGLYSTTDFGAGADLETYGVSASYTMDALTVDSFYRTVDLGAASADVFGLGATYSLGGGAAIEGGVVDNDGQTLADLGVTFSF